jgi:hypothetical protein
MTPEELKQHADWTEHKDVQASLASSDVPHPWFAAYRSNRSSEYTMTWFGCAMESKLWRYFAFE